MKCRFFTLFFALLTIVISSSTVTISDTHLVRKAPSAYSDGVYAIAGANRPSPRRLSKLFMRGTDGLSSQSNRSAILAFFGEFNWHFGWVIVSEVVALNRFPSLHSVSP